MTIAEAEPASLRAYRALEGLIVTLELAPDAVATEGALVERVGLGRTPVREAIQRLAWEGLIEVRPRAGLAIAPLDPADWLKVLDARCGVEAVLARAAALNATATSGAVLRAAAREMHDAVVARDVQGFLVADKALDEVMASAAGNPFAARLAAPLQTHSRRFWYRYRRGSGLAEAAEHHVSLIRRILERDAEGAAAESDRLMALLRLDAEAAARS